MARVPRGRDHAVARGERLLNDLAAESPGRAGHEEHLVHRTILTFSGPNAVRLRSQFRRCPGCFLDRRLRINAALAVQVDEIRR